MLGRPVKKEGNCVWLILWESIRIEVSIASLPL